MFQLSRNCVIKSKDGCQSRFNMSVSTVEKFCPSISKAIHVHGNRSQLSNFMLIQKEEKSPTLLLLPPSPSLSIQSGECPFETNTGICKEGAKNANKTYLLNFCFQQIRQYTKEDFFGVLKTNVFHQFVFLSSFFLFFLKNQYPTVRASLTNALKLNVH